MSDDGRLADLDAAAGAERLVAGIRAGQWELPTLCAGVDVRALVNHLVAGNLAFAALVAGGAAAVRRRRPPGR